MTNVKQDDNIRALFIDSSKPFLGGGWAYHNRHWTECQTAIEAW